VLRFSLSSVAPVSTRKGRIVVRLDPGFPGDLVVGVEAGEGTENVCLATKAARVLIFPVAEANVVSGAAKGVTAVRLDAKDRVLGFALAGKKREGLTVRTTRGGVQVVRATKYPVASRGGKGYGILQRGSLEAVLPDEAVPVPPLKPTVPLSPPLKSLPYHQPLRENKKKSLSLFSSSQYKMSFSGMIAFLLPKPLFME